MASADHAAWLAAYATVGAAILTGLSALGVLWSAWIARSAARTWRGVHEHAKADECAAAAYDLAHAIGRVIAKRRELQNTERAPTAPAPFPSEAYDAAWEAWRRLQLAHVVAYRYHARQMDPETPARLAEILGELELWCAKEPRDLSNMGVPFDPALLTADAARAEDIRRRAWQEAEAINGELMPNSAKPVEVESTVPSDRPPWWAR